MELEPLAVIVVALRLTLGAYFVLSGAAKLAQGMANIQRSIAGYYLVPQRLAAAIGVVLPPVEVAVGLAVLSGLAIRPVALVILALLSVFTGAVAFDLLRGEQHECGCLGDLTERKISWGIVLQNAVLAIGAVGIATAAPGHIEAPVWQLLWRVGADGVATGLSGIGLTALMVLWAYAEANADAFRAFRAQKAAADEPREELSPNGPVPITLDVLQEGR